MYLHVSEYEGDSVSIFAQPVQFIYMQNPNGFSA